MTNSTPKQTTVVSTTAGIATGSTIIEDAVVAKIAGIAARDVEGVYALGGGAARMVGAIRDALNTSDLAQGIRVEVGETQVAVDVTIVAEYPVSLQKVADGVRTAIHQAMVELVNLEVTEVNVTINDVHIPSGDDDEVEVVESDSRVL
ncbi:Asp23/Gls24 family envelope stress response protein [Microbacterium sp. K24]|uniref:Asp23/Gls24 family envelope stress response protein n=1 Tax=Microbacterium sp. K24 TaxID=2305446 RepID=UPI001F1133B4|nr:Asp23/Gls24 family envelope stress response protein [Microbacterium sp. K24]